LVDFPERKIIGIGTIGQPADPKEVWPALFNRLDEIDERMNPSETIGLIKLNEHGYLAGVEAATASRVPAGMFSYIIPAGQYAAATHQGPLSKINETFEKLINWLGTNHYEQFDIVCYEVYDDRFKGEDSGSEIKMFIQIKTVSGYKGSLEK